MIDAHHVPPELQNLLMILVGNKWPTGDETALRAEAAAWREAAQDVRSCAEQVVTVKRLVDQGMEGEARQAFDDYVTGLVGAGPGDGSAMLPVLATCCDSAADSLEELANEIETLRVTIIGCLVVLWVQLMIDAAVWLFGGAETAAGEVAAARVVLLVALRRAVTIMVVRVAESVLAQVGFTLLAQLVELAQRHRGSLSGAQLRTAAINGTVGGAVGAGAGFVGGALRSGAGKLIGSGVDALADTGVGKAIAASAGLLPGGRSVLPAVGTVTGNLSWSAGYGAVAGMAEGAAQDAVFGLSGDWVSGAANGGFSGGWSTRHSAMNPGNEVSISPADHIEGGLDHYLSQSAEPHPPVAPGEVTGDIPSANDAPTPQQWSMPPDGSEGHEVWQDSPVSNGNEGAFAPLPPTDANPWADLTDTDLPRTAPASDLLSPEVEDNPWLDHTVTTSTHEPSTD
ncbi:MAG TPA: hypothetical protein VFG87_05990 [Amycolatopsis sp.]|nr:hypothetical protein [Amycolatopsis sp.]